MKKAFLIYENDLMHEEVILCIAICLDEDIAKSLTSTGILEYKELPLIQSKEEKNA